MGFSISAVTATVVALLVASASAVAVESRRRDDETSRTAYEVLEEYGFPVGLLPKGVQSYDLDPSTGKFSVRLGGVCSFKLRGAYDVEYRSTVTGRISDKRLYDLNGISVKVLFFWLNIVEVHVDGDVVHFSVGVTSASFPASNFEKCPQCGCGMDCLSVAAAA